MSRSLAACGEEPEEAEPEPLAFDTVGRSEEHGPQRQLPVIGSAKWNRLAEELGPIAGFGPARKLTVTSRPRHPLGDRKRPKEPARFSLRSRPE